MLMLATTTTVDIDTIRGALNLAIIFGFSALVTAVLGLYFLQNRGK